MTEVGPAESHCDSYWQAADDTIFTGDLCSPGQHAYLADGNAEQWLDVLAELGGRWPGTATLYPGHGEPGGPSLIDDQVDYVRAFVGAVDAHLDGTPEQRQQAVTAALRREGRDDSLLFLAQLSIEPLAAARRR